MRLRALIACAAEQIKLDMLNPNRIRNARLGVRYKPFITQ